MCTTLAASDNPSLWTKGFNDIQAERRVSKGALLEIIDALGSKGGVEVPCRSELSLKNNRPEIVGKEMFCLAWCEACFTGARRRVIAVSHRYVDSV